MSTIVVNKTTVFRNMFTKYGRSVNHLYKDIKNQGCKYILERTLPDKSRVIVAYPNAESKGAKFAFKLNTDGSMEQKTYSNSQILLPFDKYKQSITKIHADKNGMPISEKRINKDFINNELVHKNVYVNNDKYISIYEYNKYGSNQINYNELYPNVKESYNKTYLDGSRDYLYVQCMDGTKQFFRNINGESYKFTTAK